MRAAEVRAQAKINLRLKMLARESSGFHQIETLFLRLDLADTVRVRRTSGPRSLDVTGDVDLAQLGPTEDNLAWRAARAYLDATRETGGFAIEIEKHIPIGGGLGGGSADAGAVLRAFDAMSAAPLGEIGLMSLAARLGSDVPFLAATHAYALAWGRGERMLALAPPERRGVILILPGIAVHTASAYGWLSDRRAQSGADVGRDALVIDVEGISRWPTIAALAENDFEPVVAGRHEPIAEAVAAIRRTGAFELAMISGSGSTVFAIERSDAASGFSMVAKPKAGVAALASHVRTFTATRVEPVSVID